MRDWEEYVRSGLNLPALTPARERQAIEELASQLAEAYADARSAGYSEEEADAIAREHLADSDAVSAEIGRSARVGRVSPVHAWLSRFDESLRAWGGRWPSVADVLQELRQAVRRLSQSYGFSAVVLTTLAVGIGANTAVFSLLRGILLRPLPFEEAEALVSVRTMLPNVGIDRFSQSAALHFTYEDESGSVESIGMWSGGTVTVSGLEQASTESGLWVTHGLFPTLRVQPALGRTFTPADDEAGSAPTVILSHRYWQDRFGGDPGVLGETIRIDAVPREVIGVMSAGLRLVGRDPSVYVPFQIDRATTQAGLFLYQSVARLAPGVTVDEVTRELATLIPVSIERFPGGMTMANIDEWGLAPLVLPLKQEVVGGVGSVLWVLLGSAGAVLLIVCANLANLCLVRAEGRRREMAVRAALGAGRGRLALQFMIESALLVSFGGVMGLVVASAGIELLRSLGPTSLPRLSEVGLDPLVLLFTAGISILTGLVFGVLPTLWYARSSPSGVLRDGMGRAGSGKASHRTRHALVVTQIAMVSVLLVVSGLMVRSYEKLSGVDPGFGDPETVLTLNLYVPEGEVADLEEMALTHQLVAERLAELPGVSVVGLTSKLPMGPGSSTGPAWMEDFPVAEGSPAAARRAQFVDGAYFESMQIPIVAGRSLSRADVQDRAPVVVVSESLAREYWDAPTHALGRRISTGGAPGDSGWREIVGVAADVHDRGVGSPVPTVIYWPMVTSHPWPDATSEPLYAVRSMFYAVRSSRPPTARLSDDVRDAIRAINPNLALSRMQTMRQYMADSMARTSFTLVMLAIAGGAALLLGAVGVYGVIAHVVSQRTREMGVRVALGARPEAVMGIVMRQGLRLAIAGVGVGLAGSIGATRLMEGLLFGVRPNDPVTMAVVAAVIVSVALLACYVPARRAAAVDPVEALRAG